MVNRILILCVGNICRSPMAESLMRRALPECDISSAGLGALVGNPADPMAIELMREQGVDISSHRARQLQGHMLAEADLVLVMELNHQRYLEEQFPLARGKIFRLCDDIKTDITDPYRQGRRTFEEAAMLVSQGVESWTTRIRGMQSGNVSFNRQP
jgi:low molecular weight protein-tyrosine phosphatase